MEEDAVSQDHAISSLPVLIQEALKAPKASDLMCKRKVDMCVRFCIDQHQRKLSSSGITGHNHYLNNWVGSLE